MKINDLLTESQNIDEFEIPNFATKQGRAINRAEKAGAADVKQSVNDLSTEFASQLGTQGKKFNTATTDDVIAFLNTKKVDTSKIDATQPMDKKRIGVIFNTLIKDKIMGKSISVGKEEPAKKTPSGAVLDPIKTSIAKLSAKQQAAIRQQAAKMAKVA